MTPEARIRELNLQLPTAPSPMATYATAVKYGGLLYLSGHGPLRPDGTYLTGKLGGDLEIEAGREAARLTALAMLATVKAQLGSLNKVVRIVRVLGMVNATPDFAAHPLVINGFSDLMVEVFGDAALGARSAVGTVSLPAGIAVEVEATFAYSE
jgi:enamine deaminase RidA (YjgF/YER057c/UK114 family)